MYQSYQHVSSNFDEKLSYFKWLMRCNQKCNTFIYTCIKGTGLTLLCILYRVSVNEMIMWY